MSYRTHDISVVGGTLHVAEWGNGAGPIILCSHGLTATHICWQALADVLADVLGDGFRLIAPDHRGRGKSRDIKGPFGMLAHADDMVAILDHFGIAKADVMIGHSMGGFVATVAGANYPDRFGKLLLIDGGLPSIDKMPENVSAEELAMAVVGASMKRLDMVFESRAAYREFWKQHPCFATDWSNYVEAYVDYDLVGEVPTLKSGVNKNAILKDVETQLMSDLLPEALEAVALPVRFVKAPRGMVNEDPLYADDAIDHWAARIKDVSLGVIDDVNHFTIVISKKGAAAVGAEIQDLLS